jgi:epoxide hydrolase-like predicted phosphatase
MKNYKAVIFDFGGVIDYDPDKYINREEASKLFGFTYSNLRKYLFEGSLWDCAQTGKITTKKFWDSVLTPLGIVSLEDQLLFRTKYFGPNYAPNTEMVDLLISLKSKYEIALISNASDFLENFLERNNINNLFDIAVYSYKIGIAKPDPVIFKVALKELQCEPYECVFVDDSKLNIEVAEQLGIRTVHFSSPKQAKKEILKILHCYR